MRIGIDLGGTKIEGIVLDDNGVRRALRRVATPTGDYEQTIDAVVRLVHALEIDTAPGASVGVGIPGAVSPATGLVKNANSTWLIGKRLDRDLAAALGRPVRLANDADCFAVSEATDGAAAGQTVVFGVILGTGVGGGLVVRGLPVCGINAITGEWGHNPLPWPEPAELGSRPCYCGRRGCIETFLSGAGLAKSFRDAGGTALPATEIARLAGLGDGRATIVLRRYCQRLARALAHVVNLLDPHVIVLGGGLSNLPILYEQVPALWSRWIFSDHVETRLERNRHGDASGVRGAAWLWPPV